MQSDQHIMTCELIEQALPFFKGLYTWFSAIEIHSIWRDDNHLANHLVEKWEHCNHNAVYFYTTLDNGNKKLLVDWYNNKVDDTKARTESTQSNKKKESINQAEAFLFDPFLFVLYQEYLKTGKIYS